MENKDNKCLKPKFGFIPEELKSLNQWVCWRKVPAGKKFTKVPYNPKNDYKAKVNDSSTWSSFEEAASRYNKDSYDGIGFVLTEEDPFVGFDFDNCIHDDSIYPIQMGWVDRLNSYSEIFPSGNGLRIIVKGSLPKAQKKGSWEVYSKGRYLTFTGHKLPDSPISINENQTEIDDFLKKAPIFVEIEKNLRNAFESKNGDKIRRLMQGQWEDDYPSQSEADAALCFYLASFFKQNHKAIDWIFKKSKLFRPKWDEPHYSNGETYGDHLIKHAILNAPEEKKGDTKPTPKGVTAADLVKMDIPPIKWIIRKLIAEGLSILGGKPKYGKSILALNIALAVAFGGNALGQIPVEKGTVIYLALEDTTRRLKDRLLKMLHNENAPENLILFTEWPKMDNGGISLLKEEINNHSDLRLIIIDTLAQFKPTTKSNNSNHYDLDYQNIARIKAIADEHNISILLIHHLRKLAADDVMDTFSGTLGLTGAADGLLALIKKGGKHELHVTGRDVEAKEWALKKDFLSLGWYLLGDAKNVQDTEHQQILYDALLKSNKPLSPKEITSITGLDNQYVRNTLSKMVKRGDLDKVGRGKYKVPF